MSLTESQITTANADPEELTPAMRQFLEIRKEAASQHPNMLLLYRMGDFYETFFEDAVEVNRLLGLTLTSRSGRGKNGAIPMAGIPFMTLDSYLARLVKAGKSVGIVEQIGDPAAARGTMPRKLVRVVTPGTITESELLPAKADAALAALCPPSGRKNSAWSLVTLVLSSGAFRAITCSREELPGELARIAPRELLIPDALRKEALNFAGNAQLTPLPDWHFDAEHGSAELCRHFGMQNLDAWGVAEEKGVLAAAGAVLGYVQQTQVDSVPHIRPLQLENASAFVALDPASRRNLEITEPLRNENGPTLFSTVDRCFTSMGSRMLRSWLTQPLRDRSVPAARHEAIGELIRNTALDSALSEAMKTLPDLERAASHIALGSVKPRELAGLRDALPRLSALSAAASRSKNPLIASLSAPVQPPEKLASLLAAALLPEPAVTLRDGEVIADSYSAELAELRGMRDHAGDFLSAIETRERERTGIATLRVEYNRLTGYFIEVSRGQADKVPEDYRRRQTLKNSERFTTPELKAWEDKALAAKERSLALEKSLYADLVQQCAAFTEALTAASEAAAALDALLSLSHHASEMHWVKPELSSEPGIVIRGARHPVVEQAIERYVANDCELLPGRRLLIITGPNMGGKSTYMRSIALIALLALAGSWVPADSARIGDTDRILTRIGASDDLVRGLSTFMVEMVEAASILHQATDRSLVLMDEIGRGTSTFDGLSLAGAIARTLADRVRSFTLFATHYFELTQLSQTCAEAANIHVRAAQSGGKVVFLHEVREGPASRSYGIAVAQLAGIPQPVIRQAKKMLEELEERAKEHGPQPDLFSSGSAAEDEDDFEWEEMPVPAAEPDPADIKARTFLASVAEIDPDSLTPREALSELYRLIDEAKTLQEGKA